MLFLERAALTRKKQKSFHQYYWLLSIISSVAFFFFFFKKFIWDRNLLVGLVVSRKQRISRLKKLRRQLLAKRKILPHVNSDWMDLINEITQCVYLTEEITPSASGVK